MGTEYIVIKTKDAKEKWMICGFLGSETQSEYKVVTDIKDYAVKECDGNIIEEKEPHILPNQQNGDANQMPNTTSISVSPITNVIDDIRPSDNMPSSTTDNNDMDNVLAGRISSPESEAVSTGNTLQGGSQLNDIHQPPTSSNNHLPTQLSSSSDPQEVNLSRGLTSQIKNEQRRRWGTFIPYRHRMLKPKGEIVEKQEIITLSDDEDDDAPTSAPLSAIEHMLNRTNDLSTGAPSPSSSVNAPIASIGAPRAPINAPSYNQQLTEAQRHLQHVLNARANSMRDTLQNQRSRSVAKNTDDCPAPKRSRSRSRRPENSLNSGGAECKVCHRIMSGNYKYHCWAKEHAITHLTDLKRFQCLIPGCTYQTGPKTNMQSHMNMKHQGTDQVVGEIRLTNEQMKEWEDMIERCFPGVRPMK